MVPAGFDPHVEDHVRELRERAGAIARGFHARTRCGDPIVEQAPAAIGVHISGRVIYANAACASLFGFGSPEDMLGIDILEVIVEEHHPTTIDRVWKQFSGEEFDTAWKCTGLRADGATVPLLVFSGMLEIPGGRASLAMGFPVGTVTAPDERPDVSPEEEALRLRERIAALELFGDVEVDLCDRILEAAPLPIIVHDVGEVLYANPAAVETLRYPDEAALVGASLSDIVREREVMAERAAAHREGRELDPWFSYEVLRGDRTWSRVTGVTGRVGEGARAPLFSVILESTELEDGQTG